MTLTPQPEEPDNWTGTVTDCVTTKLGVKPPEQRHRAGQLPWLRVILAAFAAGYALGWVVGRGWLP